MVKLKPGEIKMKSEIFSTAITNRYQIRFLYGLSEVVIDPYYITKEKSGKKVLYGRVLRSSEIKKFDFDRIVNIKVIDRVKFTPLIPIITLVN